MKILLWGCTYSMWTIHFIKMFLLENNYEVWLLKNSSKKEYLDFFEEMGVHLIECPKLVIDWYDGSKRASTLKTLYIHFLQIKAAVKSGHFDLINLHYVDYTDIIDVVILKCIMQARLILSYWGSDLLRVSDRILSFAGLFGKRADYITFDNGDLRIKFEQKYKWKDRVKSSTALFGLSILDIIKEEQTNKSNAFIRKMWGVSEHKKVVAIGYNGIPQQQHIAVLECIKNIDEAIKEQICILLQMSYGGTDEYRKTVIEAAKKAGCQYLVIECFMTDEEVADIRIMTDIFINAQMTDAFSGSVCENLFSNSILINARWLRYQEFDEHDFKYLEFENIFEIGEIIQKVLEQGFDVSGNKELIWKLRSWESCGSRWKRIYREVLGNYEESVGYRS